MSISKNFNFLNKKIPSYVPVATIELNPRGASTFEIEICMDPYIVHIDAIETGNSIFSYKTRTEATKTPLTHDSRNRTTLYTFLSSQNSQNELN